MKIYTIGSTKTTAESFFNRIKGSGVQKMVDVRLNNVSQLAGFAKRDDLQYFIRAICGIGYQHELSMAPTKEILDAYKKYNGPWATYKEEFLNLIAQRKIETLDRESLNGACLLCSEDTPHRCHRRLVAEYLHKKWDDVEIIHL